MTPGGRNAIRKYGIGASFRPQVIITCQPAESTAFTVRDPEKLAAALGPIQLVSRPLQQQAVVEYP